MVKVYDDAGNLIREGEERTKNTGFVVRYELLGIIGIMIIQTLGGVWWAATMTSDSKYMRAEMADIKLQLASASNGKYTTAEAVKDFGVIEKRLDKLETRVMNLERGVVQK